MLETAYQPRGNILAMVTTNSFKLTEQGKMLQWQVDDDALVLGTFVFLDWLKMLSRKPVKEVDASKGNNGSVFERVHTSNYKLDVENSALEAGEDVHTLERMQEA